MFKIIKSYLWNCTTLSFKASYESANNVGGAILATGATYMLGSLEIITGTSKLILAVNGIISTLIYFLIVWVLIFTLRFIFIAPFKLYKELQENGTNAIKAPSINILIGTEGLFEKTKSHKLYYLSRTIYVAVKNTGSGYVSNCIFEVDIINDKNEKTPYCFKGSFTLNEGQEDYIALASYNEVIDTSSTRSNVILMHMIQGGFAAADTHIPSANKHIITLRVTSKEAAPCEINCVLWVDSDGKMKLQKA